MARQLVIRFITNMQEPSKRAGVALLLQGYSDNALQIMARMEVNKYSR